MADPTFPPLTPASVLLTERVAVVTGAAQGIGRACAVALARFGAHVAISDRDADGLAGTAAAIEASGRNALQGVLDVRDTDAVEAHVDAAKVRLGAVDVLVNNAGGGFHADFVDVAAKGQDALIRENFTSVTNFIRACVARAPERGQSIVNMTSIEAHRAAPGYAVYAAMKAGVASLSQSLALELGARHIRVNCIAMDVIPTPGIGGEPGMQNPHTPLPMVAHADDVAAAAVYLASDMSRFVTGTTIHVDGGNLAAAGWVRQADGTFTTV
ncbi:MAG TPA: SDR family oxidoreductase [Acidimicrobiia bacterium]